MNDKKWLKQMSRIAKEHGEAISKCNTFLCIFDDHFLDHPVAMLQFAAAVYLNKPFFFLVPEGTHIPENFKRLAIAIEFYKFGNQQSLKDAMERLMLAGAGQGVLP